MYNLNDLAQDQLRNICVMKGLSPDGTKKDLVERLTEHRLTGRVAASTEQAPSKPVGAKPSPRKKAAR